MVPAIESLTLPNWFQHQITIFERSAGFIIHGFLSLFIALSSVASSDTEESCELPDS